LLCRSRLGTSPRVLRSAGLAFKNLLGVNYEGCEESPRAMRVRLSHITEVRGGYGTKRKLSGDNPLLASEARTSRACFYSLIIISSN